MKIIISLLCLIIFFNNILHGIDVGKVVNITGDKILFMKKSKTDKGILLKKTMFVKLDHYIQTGKNTTAEINLHFNDMNTTIKVRKNSLIKIVDQIKKKKKNGIFLCFGRLWSLVSGKKKTKYAVETHNSVAGVEGTEFEVGYDKSIDQTILLVSSGKVKFVGKKSRIPGIPQIKQVIKKQISVIEKGKNIKILKNPTSEKYKSYYKKLLRIGSSQSSLLPTIENKNVDEVEFIGLSSNEKFEGVVDETDGISLTLQILEQRNITESTMPVQLKAYVWIDGCNYFNEKQLVYRPGKPLTINNLTREIHEVTILCGGYQSEFDIDLSEVTGNTYLEKIRYILLELYFVDKIKDDRLNKKETFKLNISVNGQKLLFPEYDSLDSNPKYLYFMQSADKLQLYLTVVEKNFTISVDSKKFESTSIEIDLDGSKLPHLISLDLNKEK